MAAFEYIALDARGRQQKGVLEGDSARQVRQLLRDKQLSPLQVEPVQRKEEGAAGGFTLAVGQRRIATKQLLVATNGYTGALLPFLQRRIIPIRSALIATGMKRMPQGPDLRHPMVRQGRGACHE